MNEDAVYLKIPENIDQGALGASRQVECFYGSV